MNTDGRPVAMTARIKPFEKVIDPVLVEFKTAAGVVSAFVPMELVAAAVLAHKESAECVRGQISNG